MRAQVVSEGERPRFLRVTRANNMHVVSVRPDVRLMEEGAERIVRMGHVLVGECSQGHGVLLERVKLRDGNLDVDHRLGREAAHRSRPVVLNSDREWPKDGGDAVAFCSKRLWPRIVIRNNLQSQHGPSISLNPSALGLKKRGSPHRLTRRTAHSPFVRLGQAVTFARRPRPVRTAYCDAGLRLTGGTMPTAR